MIQKCTANYIVFANPLTKAWFFYNRTRSHKSLEQTAEIDQSQSCSRVDLFRKDDSFNILLSGDHT